MKNKIETMILVAAALALPALAHAEDETVPAAPTAPTPAVAPAKAPATKAPLLTDEERKELAKARADALKANPDLVAASKDLEERHQAWQKKVDEAAVVADPKVAPILAKIAAAHPAPKPADKKPADKSKKTPKTPTPKTPKTPSTNAPSATPPTQ